MPKNILETQTSFCDGIQSIISLGESVRFFAPLSFGQKIKNFDPSERNACAGVHVGINEAGRKGLICFYFVEFPDAQKQEFKSGIVLLSLIRERDQLATLFNPTRLASLLKCDEGTARQIVDSLKQEFLAYQRLKLMYGIYQLMKA